MPKAVAKKKRRDEIKELMSPEAQRKAERELKHYVDELDERSEERQRYVDAILDANDDEIARIHRLMIEQLEKMEGPPKIIYKGHTYNAVRGETELLARIQARNFAWIAVRCLVACAEWGILIGDFKLPSNACARCGVMVKKGKKKRA